MQKNTTSTHAPVTTSQVMKPQQLKNKATAANEEEEADAMESDAEDSAEDDDSDMEVDVGDDDDVSLQIDSEDEAELEAQRIRFDAVAAAAAAAAAADAAATTGVKQRTISSSAANSSDGENASITSSSRSTVICSTAAAVLKETMLQSNKSVAIKPKNVETESVKKANAAATLTTLSTHNMAAELATRKDNKEAVETSSTQMTDNSASDLITKTTATTPTAHALDTNTTIDANTVTVPVKRRGRPPGKKRQRANSNSSLGSTNSSVAPADVIGIEPCGNVYVNVKEQSYIYTCRFCDVHYGDLQVLSKHLYDVHNLLDDHSPKRKSARKKTEEVNIKQEPIAADVSSLDACGKLMVANRRKIRIICVHCESAFEKFELMDKHLRAHHELFKSVVVTATLSLPEEAESVVMPKVEPTVVACESPLVMVAIPSDVEMRSEGDVDEAEHATEVLTPTPIIANTNESNKTKTSDESADDAKIVDEIMAEVVKDHEAECAKKYATEEVEDEQSVKTGITTSEDVLVGRKRTPPGKRGRRKQRGRPKKTILTKVVPATTTETTSTEEKQPRKRGRKPKQQRAATTTATITTNANGPTESSNSNTINGEQDIKEETPEEECVDIKEVVPSAAAVNNNMNESTSEPTTPPRRTRKSKPRIDYAVDIKDEDDDDDDDDVNDSGKQNTTTSSEYSPSSSNSDNSPIKQKLERPDETMLNAATKMLLIRTEVTPGGTTRHTCNICDKSFNKMSRMQDHQRLHTGEKPFVCAQCGRAFRLKMRLSEHMLRHRTEKAFKCEICQLPVSTRQDLALHMRHHKEDRRYKCDVCDKAFVRRPDLAIHVRIHTGEKPFNCDFCGKAFRAPQNLIVHRRSHVGDKPIKCELCEKRFARKIDLRVHMRKHTGEKPYKCDVCNRGYSSRVNMHRHMEREHVKGEHKKKPGRKTKNLKQKLEQQENIIDELTRRLSAQGLPTIAEDGEGGGDTEIVASADDANDKHKSPTLLQASKQSKVDETAALITVADAGAGCDAGAALVQQVSVTVSMQVEQVNAEKVTAVVGNDVVEDMAAQPEKENENTLVVLDTHHHHHQHSPPAITTPHGKSKNVNRKITSYFTVVGQQAAAEI